MFSRAIIGIFILGIINSGICKASEIEKDILYKKDKNTRLLLHFNNNDQLIKDECGTACKMRRLCDGKFGSAIKFDGETNYISTMPGEQLNINDEITIELWFNIEKIDSGRDLLFKNWNWRLTGYGQKRLRMIFYDESGKSHSIMTPAIQLGKWNHIAAVYTSRLCSLYLNGILIDNRVTGLPLRNECKHPLFIGKGAKDKFFNGKLDELRISNCIRYIKNFDPKVETKASYSLNDLQCHAPQEIEELLKYRPKFHKRERNFFFGVYLHHLAIREIENKMNLKPFAILSEQLKDIKKHCVNLLYSPNCLLPVGQNYLDIIKQNDLLLIPGLANANFNSGYISEDLFNKYKGIVQKYKNERNILYWVIRDEAEPDFIYSFIKLKKMIEENSPMHWGDCGTVDDMSKLKVYAPYLNIISKTTYPIYKRGKNIHCKDDRDPLRPSFEVKEMVKLAHGRPVWEWGQTFDYRQSKWTYPTAPEIRLVVYSSIANGAKGIRFFLYNHLPLWWKDRWGEPLEGLVNMWGEPTIHWNEIEKIGRKLLPIGKYIANSEPLPNNEINIESEKITIRGELAPAIGSGILKLNETENDFLIICYNKDTLKKHKGQFAASEFSDKKINFYDLSSVKRMELKEGKNGQNIIDIFLAPGDARIIFAGTVSKFEEIKTDIFKTRFSLENETFSNDLDLAQKNGLQLADVNKILEKLNSPSCNSNYEKRLDVLNEAKVKLEWTMMNSQPFSSVNSDFVKIRKDFTEIDEKMNALMLEKKNKKLFEECRTMIIEASRKYFVLQGDFRDGKSALIKNDAAQLRQKLEKILYDMPSEK